MAEVKFEVVEDLGAFGDGKWQKHLTKTKWNGNDAKYDIRPWNEDMSKCGKGVTLDDAELYDLQKLIGKVLG